MSYIVTKDSWLAEEAARVSSIIKLPRLQGKIWDDKSLQAELNYIGLPYSTSDVALISGKLLLDKVVEDVKIDPVEPAPVVEPPAAPVTPEVAVDITPL